MQITWSSLFNFFSTQDSKFDFTSKREAEKLKIILKRNFSDLQYWKFLFYENQYWNLYFMRINIENLQNTFKWSLNPLHHIFSLQIIRKRKETIRRGKWVVLQATLVGCLWFISFDSNFIIEGNKCKNKPTGDRNSSEV